MSERCNPKVAFLIPLRAQSTTRNWPRVEQLLRDTITSVTNSLDSRYQIIIAGHEPPAFDTTDSRVEFHAMDFPPPHRDSLHLPDEDRIYQWHSDKGRKLLYALDVARGGGYSYFMPLDADDFISSRLVGYCLEEDHPNGYFIDHGYRLNNGNSTWMYSRRRFYQECGSSCVLRTSIAPFPEQMDLSLEFDDYFIRRYVVHAYIPSCMEGMGFPLQPLPFHAGIYQFHEENIFANSCRSPSGALRSLARWVVRGCRVTQALRDEFAIP